MKAIRNKKVITAIAIIVAVLAFSRYFAMRFIIKSESFSGKIFLYGEAHSVEDILEKEFELWSSYYRDDGMRISL